MRKKLNLILLAVLTAFFFVGACANKTTVETNKVVDSGKNTDEAAKSAVDSAKKKVDEAQAVHSKRPKVESKITNNPDEFEENKNANEAEIKDALNSDNKCAELLKSAAGDFRQASKLYSDQTFKDYYEAKTRQMEGLAELSSTQGSILQDFLDSSDADTAKQKTAAKRTRMNELDKSLTETENKVAELEASLPNAKK